MNFYVLSSIKGFSIPKKERNDPKNSLCSYGSTKYLRVQQCTPYSVQVLIDILFNSLRHLSLLRVSKCVINVGE